MLTTREMYALPAYETDRIITPRRRDILTLILAALPLFVHMQIMTAANGRITAYSDVADIALGILLLFVTLTSRSHITASTGAMKSIRLVMTIALTLLAVLYIVTGCGMHIR